MKKIISLIVVSLMTMHSMADDVTSAKITIGSTDYTMEKVEGVTPEAYTVTVNLAPGNYSATCTLVHNSYGTKTSSPTTFTLKEEKNVTFWGSFPTGKNWVAILSNANEYSIMNDKWRYYFYSAPNYDAPDPGVSVSYFVAFANNYTFQSGTGTKDPTNEFIMTSNQSGNPPFTYTKQSTTTGIKKATLTYAEWKVVAEEATELPVKIGASGAATLCAPANLTIPSGVKAYTLAYDGVDALVATPVTTTIPANTPVLLNAAPGNYAFAIDASTLDIITGTYNNAPYMPDVNTVGNDLYGVLMPHYAPADSYVLQNGVNGVGFYKVTTANYRVNPFRAYIKLTAAPSRSLRLVFNDDVVTDIRQISTMVDDNAVFNLSGQRVDRQFKGVVVKNGRKMIQK